MASQKFEYDVCLSFAGEDRPYVEQVAAELTALGVRHFYDEADGEDVALWGKDLYEHFSDVYENKARHCVMFLSKSYAEKAWTKHERRSAQARALTEDGYILPARFDDTAIPGIRKTIKYVDLRNLTPSVLAQMVKRKLDSELGGIVTAGEPPTSPAAALPHSPWNVVPAVSDAVVVVPHGHAAGVKLARDVPPAFSRPCREVAVVPYSVPQAVIPVPGLVQEVRGRRIMTAQGTEYFPMNVPLETTSRRSADGVQWHGESDWGSTTFGVGADASFAFREAIRELTHRRQGQPPGIGLFSCLDRIVGALVFARAFSRGRSFSRAWLVFTLEWVHGQTLVLDYENIPRVMRLTAGRATTETALRIGGHFQTDLDDAAILAFTAELGSTLAYWFDWTWQPKMVLDELAEIVRNATGQVTER